MLKSNTQKSCQDPILSKSQTKSKESHTPKYCKSPVLQSCQNPRQKENFFVGMAIFCDYNNSRQYFPVKIPDKK
jgi:hypothetical protein